MDRSPTLDEASIRLTPAEAFAKLDALQTTSQSASRIRLNAFGGRPVYRFRMGLGERLVYADTGEEQRTVSRAMIGRVAALWTGRSIASAKVQPVEEVDQWTVQGPLRNLRPLWKYSWPNGEEVYVNGKDGEVVQYTTSTSRFWAWLGPIPHWLHFTPLGKHQVEWTQVVIWSSGIG